MRYGHIAGFLGLLALSSCSSGTVKETLGLNRSAPDEFRVISRPPLSVPPQFTLRPPATSGEPDQPSASQAAQQLFTGKGGIKLNTGNGVDTAVVPVKVKDNGVFHGGAVSGSKADAAFLKNAGADKADPNVRSALAEEKYQAVEKQEASDWWDIFSSEPDKKDPLVDAPKESERIQTNEDEGKSVTEGETPEIKQRDTGILGRIFGY